MLGALAAPAPTYAEWFIDAYGGYSWTATTDVELSGTAKVSALGFSSAIPFRWQLFQRENR
jgi:hypothetical protein